MRGGERAGFSGGVAEAGVCGEEDISQESCGRFQMRS